MMIVFETLSQQGVMMRKVRTRKKVPWTVTCGLPFVPYTPWSGEWEEEVRLMIRKANPMKSGMIDLYDQEVDTIIGEEAVLS